VSTKIIKTFLIEDFFFFCHRCQQHLHEFSKKFELRENWCIKKSRGIVPVGNILGRGPFCLMSHVISIRSLLQLNYWDKWNKSWTFLQGLLLISITISWEKIIGIQKYYLGGQSSTSKYMIMDFLQCREFSKQFKKPFE
jgi:hypothetical protein